MTIETEIPLNQLITQRNERVSPSIDSSLQFIGMDCITPNSITVDSYHDFKNFKSSGNAFKQGDVLYGRLRPYLNKVTIANIKGVASGEFLVLTPNAALIPKFLLYLLHHRKFVKHALDQVSGDRPRVKFNQLANFKISLPPLPEQRAIVTKLEQLFSELGHGIGSLEKAQRQLKVYRQAVLKGAFEGKLTQAWRDRQTDLPSAEALLVQIKEAREQHYKEQLTEWKAAVKAWDENGKVGRKPSKPKRLKEISNIAESHIKPVFNIPYGWRCMQMSDISIVSGGLTKNSKREILEIKMPFLRVANVYFHKLKLTDLHIIGIKEQEINRVLLKKGDILMVEGNGSIDQLGRAARWNGEISNCVHQNHIIKARPFSAVSSMYLLYFINSEVGRKLLINEASSTSGLHTLSLSKVENIKIPCCGIEEQHQIVQEIESRLSVCDKLEESIRESLQKAEALRQSILKKAFEGKLLTEAELEACRLEEDWEPAGELLERIRSEK